MEHTNHNHHIHHIMVEIKMCNEEKEEIRQVPLQEIDEEIEKLVQDLEDWFQEEEE